MVKKRCKTVLAAASFMLLISISTGLVDVAIAKSYFNITQSMNLSQLIGRSDLNDTNLANSTSPQQPVHLVDGIYGDSDQYPAHTIDGAVPNTTLQQGNWMGSDSGLPSTGSLVAPSPGSQGWADEIIRQLGLGSQGSQSPASQNPQLPAFLQGT